MQGHPLRNHDCEAGQDTGSLTSRLSGAQYVYTRYSFASPSRKASRSLLSNGI